MTRTLYRRAQLSNLAGPHSSHLVGEPAAVLVIDDRIAWIGADADADAEIRRYSGPAPARVDLDGALVLPGFVDSHVHVTETGLLLSGIDLSMSRSVEAILDLVAASAAARPGHTILGHGWDELNLSEGRPPTAAELDRAGSGAQVYLSRVDVHSAVVSGALADHCDLPALTGWHASGRVERDAHHAARRATRFALNPADRRSLQLLALRSAAEAGITEVHEMSAPHVAPESDLVSLMTLELASPLGAASSIRLPDVVPYRGELATDEQALHEILTRFEDAGLPVGAGWAGLAGLTGLARGGLRTGLAGLAGDLMVDGSFGSRTASLSEDYADSPGHRGHLYLSADQVRDHVVTCTKAGLQAGFHVIGDAAVDTVLTGFKAAADLVGLAVLRAARHRIEHLEAIDSTGVGLAAQLGLIASVQPAFDAAWGGDDGMYAIRLGRKRAAGLNPFATMVAEGVEIAFGSDSPVTPFAPWEGIRAALRHQTAGQRIEIHRAVSSYMGSTSTSTSTFAAGRGALQMGAPATFSCWQSPALRDLQRRTQPWGLSRTKAVDPLQAVAAELLAGSPPPTCLLTIIRGQVAFARH